MNNIFALTRVILKNTGEYIFGSATKKNQKRAAKAKGPWATLLLFAALFVITGFSLGMSSFSVTLLAVNEQAVPELVTIAIPFMLLFLWIFTLTIVISTFFLSSDTSVFLPLPIKPSDIFFARFVSCLVSTYLLQVLFLLPTMIGFNIAVAPYWTSYIYQFFVFVAAPFFPLAFTFLLAMLIGKFFNIAKHRDLFNIIMALLMIAVIMVMQFAFTTPEMSDPSVPGAIGDVLRDTVAQFGFLNVLLQYPRDAIVEAGTNGLFGLVVFLFMTAILFFIAFFVAEKSYLKILLHSDASKGKKRGKANLDKEMLKDQKNNSPFWALVRKEWRAIMRSPNYVFQLVIPPLLILVIYGVIFGVMLGSGAEGMPQMSLGDLAALAQTFVTNERGGLVLIVTGVSMFVSSMNQISATAISREGSNAYLMRIIPQKPIDQIRAKMFLGILVSGTILLIFYVSLAILLMLPILIFIQLIVPSLFALVLANYLMILVDIKMPMLVWENELAPVKQNKTMFFGMLICWAFATIFTVGGSFLIMIDFPVFYVFVLLSVICALFIYWIERSIQRKGSSILFSIE